MTLSVDAIKNYSQVNYSRNNLKSNEAKAQPSFGQKNNNGLLNAAKYVIIGGVAFPVATSLMSCEDNWFANAKSFSYSESKSDTTKNDCGCCKPIIIQGKDTLYIPVYKNDTIVDTITQIINTTDTVYVEKENENNYEILDSINSILDDLGVERNGKYPLKISYVDEMDTRYKQHVLDQRTASDNQAVYNSTSSPWSDEEGQFIIGSNYDKKSLYLCSFTDDKKVMVMKFNAKPGINNPKSLADYQFASEAYVFDKDYLNKTVLKYNLDNNSNKRTYDWTMKKGPLPNSVEITNPYDTNWRLTNIKVTGGDLPSEK